MFKAAYILALTIGLLFCRHNLYGNEKVNLDQKNKFVFALTYLPNSLDNLTISSAQHHLLLRHLTRPLINLSIDGSIEGDLAESWTISSDYKVYSFVIRQAKYSDGMAITAEEVKKSLERGLKRKDSIHFDFKKILAINTSSNNTVIITLTESNPNFLKLLRHPELSILSTKDAMADVGKQQFITTSGPYYLGRVGTDELTLIKNPHYENAVDSSPDEVTVRAISAENLYERMLKKEVDLGISPTTMTAREHAVLTNEVMKPFIFHMGFTFWVSINPNSAVGKNKELRRYFQFLLRPTALNTDGFAPLWTKARQLYLPDNAGRPSDEWIDNFWKEVEQVEKPKILPKAVNMLMSSTYVFKSQIVEAIEKAGINVKVDYYLKMEEFSEKMRKGEYDLVQINNDFSSLDVMSNLLVTFADIRPLIFTEKKASLKKQVDSLEGEIDIKKRYPIYEEIAKEVLVDALIVPISYFNIIYYYRPNLDISRWSTLFSDVSLWKVAVQKNL